MEHNNSIRRSSKIYCQGLYIDVNIREKFYKEGVSKKDDESFGSSDFEGFLNSFNCTTYSICDIYGADLLF
jgi:hypothetical protein